MKKSFVFCTLLVLIVGLCSFVNVTDDEMLASGVDQSTLEELKSDSVYGKSGVIK